MDRKPALHGRDHRAGGADPIAGGGIAFGLDPQPGDWLAIDAGPPQTPTTEPVALYDASGGTTGTFAQVLIQSQGSTGYWPIVLRTSEDNGVNWTEFQVGYRLVQLFNSPFEVWDDMGNRIFAVDTTAPGLAFFGAATFAQQVVTGSRGGNAALASLLTALSNYGLIVDSST